MVNGLPGTGIGGLFYLLLAALMPVREGVRALGGKSRAAHWRFIALQWGLILSVLVALWGQGVLLRMLFESKAMKGVTAAIDPTGVMNRPVADWAGAAATASLYSLAGVVLVVEASRLISLAANRRAQRRLRAA